MFWPLLTLLAAAAAVAVHFWWRARYRQAQGAAESALRKLALEHERFHVFDPPRTVSGEPVRAPGTDRVIE